MKLLDIPHGLCDRVVVVFSPETWDEFDRSVVWLVQNGVPLAWKDEQWHEHLVFVRGKRPYANGKMLNVTLKRTFGHVEATEGVGVEYTVYMPNYIR